MNSNTNTTRIVALVAVIVLGGGALIYSLAPKNSTTTTTPVTTSQAAVMPSSTSSTTTATPTQSVATQSTAQYKDGTYTATGSYQSPGGDEKLGVTVTLKNDVITAARVTPEPVSPEGRQFQSMFASGFQTLVVGKDISSVHLTHVSGASLTPIGFNAALALIEAQAKNS